jgi:c(7)-type cytochrome triheme protein
MFDRPAQSNHSTDPSPLAARKKRLSLLILSLGSLMITVLSLSGSPTSALAERPPLEEATPLPFTYRQAGGNEYAKFTHRNAAHLRLPCLLCHRREVNLMQPKRPGHTPCAGCHAQEFANPASSICTICHSNPAAEKPDLKAFPRLTSFNVKFDHGGHQNADCSTCHKPTGRNNVAFSIPSGFAAHRVCYQCHTERAQSAGRDISSCGTCHRPGSYSRTPVFTRAFQVSFSHAKHGKNQRLDCGQCHQVKAGQAQQRQVSSPIPAQHAASERALSCLSCHNGKRAFGGDDFKSCQRCHTGPTFRFQ